MAILFLAQHNIAIVYRISLHKIDFVYIDYSYACTRHWCNISLLLAIPVQNFALVIPYNLVYYFYRNACIHSSNCLSTSVKDLIGQSHVTFAIWICDLYPSTLHLTTPCFFLHIYLFPANSILSLFMILIDVIIIIFYDLAHCPLIYCPLVFYLVPKIQNTIFW